MFFGIADAQTVNGLNTIGLRGTAGAEVSYQRYISNGDRVEATTGVNRYGFALEGVYQVVKDLPINTDGVWNYYYGGGVGSGIWSDDHHSKGLAIGFLAQAGMEYRFLKVPFVISLDYRPGYYFVPESEFDWTGAGLTLRYVF